MAVTPNYSWPTPDNTDLVRDGAAAIRDLGNAIDATVDGLPIAEIQHFYSSVVGSAPYCLPGWSFFGTVTNANQDDDRIYAHVFSLPKTASFTEIAVDVTTAASAGGALRFAIYTVGSDGLPGALVVDSGTVNTTTTGVKVSSLSPTLSLNAGVYYIVHAVTNLVRMTGISGSNAVSSPITGFRATADGSLITSGLIWSSGGNTIVSSGFLSTLPAPTSQGSLGTVSCRLRLA